ncbi:MAG TPA: chloride channel protein [Terracidiphilus sp.]|nr:chloride channel protein [Terracidiphilus sp.]
MKVAKHGATSQLRDFNADYRMILLSGLSLILGGAGAVLAWVLLRLIYGCTNLFYYQRLSWKFTSPALNHMGWLAVFVPIVGGLIVGVMARYGSEKIRGHGIPEALESILVNGAKISPRVALFKPLGSAVAIGTGGPFGAEGPIIMTAGSVGSLFAQYFHLTDAERSTLLVAGAAAGMAGVFSTPLAATLLAVELLLFEWRPRSFVPVAVAAATAGVLRHFFIAQDPLFPMPLSTHQIDPIILLGALLIGLGGGVLALLLSRAVYASEDFFENHLPIHWMWWPAIGGVVVGLGGLIFPRALATGYDVIDSLLAGDHTWQLIAGILVIKSIIWSFSLGSGTSGGILAPLLMIGGAMGAAFAPVLPGMTSGSWALVGMTAVLSGSIGCPLTAAVLSLELTHNYGLLLPVFTASVVAHACAVMVQKRSILTERISRRGYHLSREYSVDPLETIMVAEAVRPRVIVLPAELTAADASKWLGGRAKSDHCGQRLYPLVNADGRMTGVITRSGLAALAKSSGRDREASPAAAPVVAYPDETLRTVAERMASRRLFVLPVVERETGKLVGLLNAEDVLAGRTRAHDRENRYQRLRMPFRWSRRRKADAVEQTV